MDTDQLSPVRPAPAASAQVISLGDLHVPPASGERRLAVSPAGNPLHAIRTTLQVCVGEIEMTVGQLMAAAEHEVLALDTRIDAPVDLRLQGRVVARGQLVALDGRFALRITELPLPLST